MEIKYRQKDIVKTMARLDKKFSDLQGKLKSPGDLLSSMSVDKDCSCL